MFFSIACATIAAWVKNSADGATAGSESFFQMAWMWIKPQKQTWGLACNRRPESGYCNNGWNTHCMFVVPSVPASQQEMHNEEKNSRIKMLISCIIMAVATAQTSQDIPCKPRPRSKDNPKPQPGDHGSRRRPPSTSSSSGSPPRTAPHRG